MADFAEIDEARKLLGLGEEATLKEIKKAYRTLAHRYHPDKTHEDDGIPNETMKKMNDAYKLLIDYSNVYKYSFREKDVGRTYPNDEYLRKYKEKWYNSI